MPSISAPELTIDPLAVLRCDSRVFRTGPILHNLLYMLKACLVASRTSLSQCFRSFRKFYCCCRRTVQGMLGIWCQTHYLWPSWRWSWSRGSCQRSKTVRGSLGVVCGGECLSVLKRGTCGWRFVGECSTLFLREDQEYCQQWRSSGKLTKTLLNAITNYLLF